jgi:hypothetical protein
MTWNRVVGIDHGILSVLRRTFDLTTYRRIVAVGGHQAWFLTSLLRLAPQAEGVLFDRARVIDDVRVTIEQHGLSDRISLATGDYLEKVPPGGDLYLLTGVLHDYDDESAGWLLDSCYMAAVPHSTLLAVEGVPPTGSAAPVLSPIDIYALPAGGERTVEEFEELFNDCGYELVRAIPIPAVEYPPLVMLEGRRS